MPPKKLSHSKPEESKPAAVILTEQLSDQPRLASAISNFLNDRNQIMKLRAAQHTWRDDRQCKDDEESWRDPVFELAVMNTCNNICMVRRMCLEEDRQLGAEPGIKAGLTEKVRIRLYQAMAETSLRAVIEVEQPQA